MKEYEGTVEKELGKDGELLTVTSYSL